MSALALLSLAITQLESHGASHAATHDAATAAQPSEEIVTPTP